MAIEKTHFLIPDLPMLRKDVRSARGMERRLADLLHLCLSPKFERRAREVYDLHWTMIYLLEGGDKARAAAREAVWIEAMEGGPKERPGHRWDEPNFLRMHFWIAAAMGAHIAVAVDWLAAEKVFTPKEVKVIGANFVEKFWCHIFPHLKGRGRSPIYVEPMNQDAAMVVGCLVIGHLFGWKWGSDPRARRMYSDARVLAGNLMGQFFKTGFDNDGFTYMRLIQPPVLTLLSMVLEEVEGSDFFFRTLPPNEFSVAMFMEKLQKFMLPSGTSLPYGRYGYVQDWNLYSQAYAARKTGESHYLERCLAADQKSFINPWIAMDLPLAVAWAPYGKQAGVPRKKYRADYESWHDTDIWSTVASPTAKIHAHLCWRTGQQATYILEQDGSRCVVLVGEGSKDRNGLDFLNVATQSRAGSDFRYLCLPGVQISRVQLKDQWDPRTIRDYSKTLMVLDEGLVLNLDHYCAYLDLDVRYQYATLALPKGQWLAAEKGNARIQALNTVEGMRSEKTEGRKGGGFNMNSAMMPRDYRGFAATLFNFSEPPVKGFRRDEQSLSWTKGDKSYALHLNADLAPILRTPTRGQTDAHLLMSIDEGLVFFNARRWERGRDRLWSTERINLGWMEDHLSVEAMGYGEYLRFCEGEMDLSILRGTGYDIYLRSPRKMTLQLPVPSSMAMVQLNGSKVVPTIDGNTLRIEYRPDKKSRSGDADNELAESMARAQTGGNLEKSRLFSAMDSVLLQKWAPALPHIRELLDYDDTYIRLSAAEVLGWLGEESDSELLTRKLIHESGLTSSIGGEGAPWFGKWQFFSAVTVMADAIRKLGDASVSPLLEKALSLQVEPHAKASIRNALKALRGE